MQYLVRTLTDSTGHPFAHVTKARENETFTVVDAESKEEALEKVKKPKGLVERMDSVCKEQLIESLERHGINYENSGGERGVSPSLTDEQAQKLIELSETYRKVESGRLSPKPEKAPIPPRKDSE